MNMCFLRMQAMTTFVHNVRKDMLATIARRQYCSNYTFLSNRSKYLFITDARMVIMEHRQSSIHIAKNANATVDHVIRLQADALHASKYC